jgi:hypothetical protein
VSGIVMVRPYLRRLTPFLVGLCRLAHEKNLQNHLTRCIYRKCAVCSKLSVKIRSYQPKNKAEGAFIRASVDLDDPPTESLEPAPCGCSSRWLHPACRAQAETCGVCRS